MMLPKRYPHYTFYSPNNVKDVFTYTQSVLPPNRGVWGVDFSF
jgi:hypothetical protein